MKKLIVALFSFVVFGSFVSAGLNFGEFLTYYFDIVGREVPQSHEYIQVKYKNIDRSSDLYNALQKGIYLNYFPNSYIELPLDKPVTKKMASELMESNFGVTVSYSKEGIIDLAWLKNILVQLNTIDQESGLAEDKVQDIIIKDVYQTLITEYLNKDKIDNDKLWYGAIKGLVDAVGDKYTVFFPPKSAEDFTQDLEGEYEGIGAYVEMLEPGVVHVISPINGSPAQKAGLIAGDKIIAVDGVKLTKDMDMEDVLAMIKGPKDTQVVLTIKRVKEEFDVTIVRGAIIIDNVEHEVWENNTCYVAVHMFGYGVAGDFGRALDSLSTKNCTTYVFDMRNNPGGSLEEVKYMLDYFVPAGEPAVVIKSKNDTQVLSAAGTSFTKLQDKNIVILINKGTASASEIFAGTIKEYGDNVVLVGETSFGKGSVQSLLKYRDGSMLKYTTAKWHTGKKQINIDALGIEPDVEIQDDPDTSVDEQLEFVKKYQFN